MRFPLCFVLAFSAPRRHRTSVPFRYAFETSGREANRSAAAVVDRPIARSLSPPPSRESVAPPVFIFFFPPWRFPVLVPVRGVCVVLTDGAYYVWRRRRQLINFGSIYSPSVLARLRRSFFLRFGFFSRQNAYPTHSHRKKKMFNHKHSWHISGIRRPFVQPRRAAAAHHRHTNNNSSSPLVSFFRFSAGTQL